MCYVLRYLLGFTGEQDRHGPNPYRAAGPAGETDNKQKNDCFSNHCDPSKYTGSPLLDS